MIFDIKRYANKQHRQLLTTKEKYDTIKDIVKYKSIAHDFMFTQMSEKNFKHFGERSIAAIVQRVTTVK